MRVAVISCWGYRDCWRPFYSLMERFWPDVPYDTYLMTDELIERSYDWGGFKANQVVEISTEKKWTAIVADYAKRYSDAPILVMQEDFLLNAPVRQDLIDHALQQMQSRNAGMVRLYPCPGSDEDYGDAHVGIVKRGSKYRISCQASIFRPDYLHAIASQCGDTPSDFEIHGTKIAESLPDEVLAWKRESEPWPLSYLCSGISRGLWSQDSKKLCDLHGIEVDWSMRGFQPA